MVNGVVAQILSAYAPGESLSLALSRRLADRLATRASQPNLSEDHTLRWHLPDLCCTLHIETLASITQWPRHEQESASYASLLHSLSQIVTTRLSLSNLSPRPHL